MAGLFTMAQQSTHKYTALGACIHLLTFLGMSTLLVLLFFKAGASKQCCNSRFAPLPTPPPRPHISKLCKTGGSWECYLLQGFTTLSTSPLAMLHKWHKIYSTFILDTSL